jgi:hypothetical protein
MDALDGVCIGDYCVNCLELADSGRSGQLPYKDCRLSRQPGEYADHCSSA